MVTFAYDVDFDFILGSDIYVLPQIWWQVILVHNNIRRCTDVGHIWLRVCFRSRDLFDARFGLANLV